MIVSPQAYTDELAKFVHGKLAEYEKIRAQHKTYLEIMMGHLTDALDKVKTLASEYSKLKAERDALQAKVDSMTQDATQDAADAKTLTDTIDSALGSDTGSGSGSGSSSDTGSGATESGNTTGTTGIVDPTTGAPLGAVTDPTATTKTTDPTTTTKTDPATGLAIL